MFLEKQRKYHQFTILEPNMDCFYFVKMSVWGYSDFLLLVHINDSIEQLVHLRLKAVHRRRALRQRHDARIVDQHIDAGRVLGENGGGERAD